MALPPPRPWPFTRRERVSRLPAAVDPGPLIARVAVPSPLRCCFDYMVGESPDTPPLVPGVRVKVPFGRSTRVGLVMACVVRSDIDASRLKTVLEVLDSDPLLGEDMLEIVRWAAAYYHHPIGEVVSATLPSLLRQGRPARIAALTRYRLTPIGTSITVASLDRAPRQRALLDCLRGQAQGLTREEITARGHRSSRVLADLQRKGWVEARTVSGHTAPRSATTARVELSQAQADAVHRVHAAAGRFQAFLLDGVTGSGKTEVYLALIEAVIAQGRQALVLIPEIGLTPQMVARFEERLRVPLSVMHSGLGEQQRLRAWVMARSAEAPVVLGTRSAVFAPLRAPGVFIVDEEHDLSYKQQEGLRYSARDLAVMRARQAGVPVLLGSATPSLESLHNVALERYQHLGLPHRITGASLPGIEVLDVRQRPFEHGLSDALLAAIGANLHSGGQSLLFLNRRGYAPALMCHACGWMADCPRCDAHMVYHRVTDRLCCHHCGAEQAPPADCGQCSASVLQHVGVGTQRLTEVLARHFPDARIGRMDRDSTRRRGALEETLAGVRSGETDILIGTQMLAKGHHFPGVTLVSIIDADGGLFSVDFRAAERMAQLLVQVAGRAGRSDRPGRVLLQTHHPDHPLLRVLITEGYARFAQIALEERRAVSLPPVTSMALLRSESAARDPAFGFLLAAKEAASVLPHDKLALRGPVPAPMERRAGRFRAQLLIEARHRGALHRFLDTWVERIEQLKLARRVRWSLDVDPQDML